ncbi:Smr/MutS family protein [Pseudopontixanthobacter vadosimaris]|uniref:Smr/MutS family protein n=1 Tax=Pseudopontixanthobacter vadosimaris TaxID=2726450 RepID=UPI00147603F6|nr:Smr/MutS family protein [Pseudopontixanthobacter vadosimaris]
MRPPRGLSAEEQAAWAYLAASVAPLPGRQRPAVPRPGSGETAAVGMKGAAGKAPPIFLKQKRVPSSAAPNRTQPAAGPVPRQLPKPETGLDSHWNRKLHTGSIAPDFTLDLHGHGLDSAYQRLDVGIGQARSMGARLVLVVTGKPRPVDAADRGSKRGAIRAKILDWLAAGPHAGSIAAIRKAHRRHGGDGALYLILRRGG